MAKSLKLVVPTIELSPQILDLALSLDLLGAFTLNFSDDLFCLNDFLIVYGCDFEIPVTQLNHTVHVEAKLVDQWIKDLLLHLLRDFSPLGPFRL